MTIAEMEPLIDKIGLKKLEVKVMKGRQVHFFICAKELGKKDDYHYGDIVVFDQDGKAWVDEDTRWQIGNTYNIREWPGKGLPFQCFRIYNPAIPEDMPNWRGLMRAKRFDVAK